MRNSPFRFTWPALMALTIGVGLTSGGCASTTPPPVAPSKLSPTGNQGATGDAAATGGAAGQEVASQVPPADVELTGDAKSAYDRGFLAWRSGDLPSARTAFEDAATRAPKAAAPRYSLGCVLERLGDTQGALDAYRAAFDANAKYQAAAGGYALLLARSGRGAEAQQFLSDKLAANPNSTRLMVYLAAVKSIGGDSAGCQALAQQALSSEPGMKDAMLVIARDYYKTHRWELARYALQAILDGADDGSIPPRDKGNPEGLLLRALIERDSGQRDKALRDFALAAAKRPDLSEAYVNLGEMMLEAGNATEAQAPLEKAVTYAPNVAVAHLDLGDCYRLLGRSGDAKGELDAATRMDSTLAGTHYDLGLLYLYSPSVPGVSGQGGQLEMAIRELEMYRSMRGAKVTGGGAPDDVDELLSTAKRKQNELQMRKQAAAPPQPSQAAPTGGAPALAPAPRTKAPAPASPAPHAAPAAAPAPSSTGTIVRELPN